MPQEALNWFVVKPGHSQPEKQGICDIFGAGQREPEGGLNIKMASYQYMDPHLIFNMGIHIPEKDSLYIETGPSRLGPQCIPAFPEATVTVCIPNLYLDQPITKTAIIAIRPFRTYDLWPQW